MLPSRKEIWRDIAGRLLEEIKLFVFMPRVETPQEAGPIYMHMRNNRTSETCVPLVRAPR